MDFNYFEKYFNNKLKTIIETRTKLPFHFVRFPNNKNQITH